MAAIAAPAPVASVDGALPHAGSTDSGFGPAQPERLQSVLSSCVDSSMYSSYASSDGSFIVSGQLPVEIELRFRKVFKQCDVSRCGAFNECELMMSCSKSPDVAAFFGLPPALHQGDGSLEMVTKMFSAIDVDDDHEITWDEFHAFFGARFAAVMALQQQQVMEVGGVRVVAPVAATAKPADPAEPSVAVASAAAETNVAASSDAREGGTCSFCGKRLGRILGLPGCGLHKRAHEAKCQQRSQISMPEKRMPGQSRFRTDTGKSSVATDAPD